MIRILRSPGISKLLGVIILLLFFLGFSENSEESMPANNEKAWAGLERSKKTRALSESVKNHEGNGSESSPITHGRRQGSARSSVKNRPEMLVVTPEVDDKYASRLIRRETELDQVFHNGGQPPDLTFLDSIFHEFLFDNGIHRDDKLETLWRLFSQLPSGDSRQNYLLGLLQLTGPVELKDKLTAEYEYVTDPDIKMDLLDVLKTSAARAVYGQNDVLSATENVADDAFNTNDGLPAALDEYRRLFDEFLTAEAEQNTSEELYLQLLEAYASVSPLEDAISRVSAAVVQGPKSLDLGNSIDFAISFALDEKDQTASVRLLMAAAQQFPTDIRENFDIQLKESLDTFFLQYQPVAREIVVEYLDAR